MGSGLFQTFRWLWLPTPPPRCFSCPLCFAPCPLYERLEQASPRTRTFFLLVTELFSTNVHGERTRNEVLGTQSAWEARSRLYQYMGWKNLVSMLNMGPSYYCHFSLLVTPTTTHNAMINVHVPFTVGSQIREPAIVDGTQFQYD